MESTGHAHHHISHRIAGSFQDHHRRARRVLRRDSGIESQHILSPLVLKVPGRRSRLPVRLLVIVRAHIKIRRSSNGLLIPFQPPWTLDMKHNLSHHSAPVVPRIPEVKLFHVARIADHAQSQTYKACQRLRQLFGPVTRRTHLQPNTPFIMSRMSSLPYPCPVTASWTCRC